MNRALLLLAAAGAAMAASPALAQVAPPLEDLVTQGEILNRSALEAASPEGVRNLGQTNELDGEAGLYVLMLNEIFYVSAGVGAGYASNPTRTSTDPGGDQYLDTAANIGVSTRLGEVVDFGASLGVAGRGYHRAGEASSRSISFNTSVGRSFGRAYANIVGFGGWSYDRDLDDSTSFYGLMASASAPFKLSPRLLVRPGASVTQQWSQVAENDSFTATAAIDAIYVLTPEWSLSGRVLATERRYRDFYEDVTFVEREDDILGVSATISWRPRADILVTGSVSYEDQDSTLFLSEFHNAEGGVNFGLRKTF